MSDSQPEYLDWLDADSGVTVRLSFTVIRKLTVELMRGFGATRRRGTEPGGLLLGSVAADGKTIVVENFRSIPCEYAFGPSYVLSENDLGGWREAVEEHRADIVGYFRGHTRDGLSLDEPDVSQFAGTPGGKLALLLKPFASKPPAACLFVANGSGSGVTAGATGAEFLWSTKPKAAARAAGAAATVAAPVPKAAPPESKRTETPAGADHQPRAESNTRKLLSSVLGHRFADAEEFESSAGAQFAEAKPQLRLGWTTLALAILFTAMTLVVGFSTGYRLAGGRVQLSPTPELTPPDGPAVELFPLSLRAESAGTGVRVLWNGDAQAARRALNATFTIEEGGGVRTQTLDARELHTGTILHQPGNDVVRFRLEVHLPGDKSIGESVRWTRPQT